MGNSPDRVEVPILYIAYNRPDLSQLTFEAIRKAKPTKLFVALDGPKGSSLDVCKCDEVKRIVSNIDWECDANFLPQKENLGCRTSVVKAIDWFFSHVSSGLIIEDDCLVGTSIFGFAEALLRRFDANESISMICGFSFLNDPIIQSSYVFSKLSPIWGWATWARSWERYNSDMRDWNQKKLAEKLTTYGEIQSSQMEIFKKEFEKPAERTWGVQWRYRNLMDDKFSVVPTVSMVQNLGLGHANATKQKVYHPIGMRPPKRMAMPLEHPRIIEAKKGHDEKSLVCYYSKWND